MSPETLDAVIVGVAVAVVGGVFTILGTILGVLVGLFGERWVRRRGDVRCMIDEGDWYVPDGAYAPGSGIPRQRCLRVKFLNHKDLPVTVWEMRVEFYKGERPLEEWAEWARPRVQLVEESGNISEFRYVILPQHIPISFEIRVSPVGAHDTDQERDDKLRALEEADRAVFVATFDDAPHESRDLHPPWHA